MSRQARGLIAPQALRDLILATVRPLAPIEMPLSDAGWLVLAKAVVAGSDLPPFANAAMDGYAVRSADTLRPPVTLRVIGTAYAGRPTALRVRRGEATAIATGAPVPPGADAVVPIEEVLVDHETILLAAPVEARRHVRQAGEDVRAGEVLLREGEVLGPGQLSAAAAAGARNVTVSPRPRVALVPTGDEVRAPGEPLAAGQIYDAVSIPLLALLTEVGSVGLGRPVAPDEPAGLRRAVRAAALRADAVITIGGASMGERDLVRLLSPSGGIRSFRVALRPAKPFAFGEVFGVPLFGLPGNPASALAAFEELVRPAILSMMGKPPTPRPALRAVLAASIDASPGKLHLVRVELWHEGGRLMARPSGHQGAGMIHSLARADGWAVIPAGRSAIPSGARIDVRPMRELS
jgi:molybdopterin molybdotransferase